MAHAAGSRLGPYEIRAPLGAGAMGEVYRATDTRLQRDVAVKVLPLDVAQDAGRLARFAREARAAAALNHPNILTVFDVAVDGPIPYLVAELLEGTTLRERLAAGRLSIARALDYASQIAAGLSSAHARGIVHRDLKPANLFVTTDGRVKLLDFGLAKSTPLGDGQSVTEMGSLERTEAGQILGTLGYMAPEQLRAENVDARADIFAFGAVLYEMLAGRPAFLAASSADTISAVLSKDPPDLAASSDEALPAAIARIVRRCLEKNPAGRFQSASDLAFAIDGETRTAPSGQSEDRDTATRVAPSRGWSLGPIVAGMVCAAGLLALGAAFWVTGRTRATSPREEVVRFAIYPPEGTTFGAARSARFSVSPDGRRIAFVAETTTGTSLWVQSLDSLSAQRLPGTEGVRGSPFWSPDSRTVAFFVGRTVKRIDPGDPVPRVIGDFPGAIQPGSAARGTWSRSGVILVPGNPGGNTLFTIFQISASGGTPVAVTKPESEPHSHPSFLPDDRHFTFTAPASGVWLASIDGGTPTRLIEGASYAAYSDGHLVFVRGGVLMIQAFDPDRRQLTGESRSLGESLPSSAAPTVSVSDRVLVFNSGVVQERQLLWVDRAGKELSTIGQPAPWGNFDLSPDGSQVVVSRGEQGPGGSGSIWLLDLIRGVQTQLTFPGARDGSPIWSPDASRVAFTRVADGRVSSAVVIPAAGGTETVLYSQTGGPSVILDDWSPDGRFITFNQDPSLMALPLTGKPEPFAFVKTTSANLDESHFSPDSKWIAYNSNESGNWQVYLAPWPATGERWQVSADGGAEARWRADGRELYFLALDGTMMAVDVTLTPRPSLSAPRALFRSGISVNPRADHYAVTGDGQRFLIRRQLNAGGVFPLTVVVNWKNSRTTDEEASDRWNRDAYR